MDRYLIEKSFSEEEDNQVQNKKSEDNSDTEYSFEGFTIEFNENIMLTPIVPK
jgi:hypothetical protein